MDTKQEKQRDSSVEVFRILATFLVLIVHFTGWFVGGIRNPFDSTLDLSFRIGQTVISALCVVCVNCFLIISGWYGIKLRFKSVWKLYILLVCIYVPFQIIDSFHTGNFSLSQLADNLLVFTRESYFVQCYMMLMFLSPVINSFFEKYGRKSLNFILIFWGIEFVMESLRNNTSLGFQDGYSLIHFILIYMMARVASMYKEEILSIKQGKWIIGYFICAGIVCIEHLIGLKHTWAYSNPIVVIESFCLFFPFLYKNFYNKKINWIAGSTFAVFIIHTTNPVYNLLVKTDNWLLNNLNYYKYLFSYLFICIVIFFICIIYDKCREYLVKPFSNKLLNILNTKINHFLIYD